MIELETRAQLIITPSEDSAGDIFAIISNIRKYVIPTMGGLLKGEDILNDDKINTPLIAKLDTFEKRKMDHVLVNEKKNYPVSVVVVRADVVIDRPSIYFNLPTFLSGLDEPFDSTLVLHDEY